jgi:hypothetical protein
MMFIIKKFQNIETLPRWEMYLKSCADSKGEGDWDFRSAYLSRTWKNIELAEISLFPSWFKLIY